MRDVVLCCFESHAFERLLSESRTLEPRLLELTMDELDAMHEWTVLLGRKSARERIATLNYRFAPKSNFLSGKPVDAPFDFRLPLKQSILADYLGLTKETGGNLSRFTLTSSASIYQ